jgi:hypothetical protein
MMSAESNWYVYLHHTICRISVPPVVFAVLILITLWIPVRHKEHWVMLRINLIRRIDILHEPMESARHNRVACYSEREDRPHIRGAMQGH